jgi:site-specific DNA recombinase
MVVMKNYFAYIRVSTVKQGEHGVSLQEQRQAIERYGQRNGLTIVEWFEERETAAKRGRPIFGHMLRRMKQGKAHGVIIHKIDRSARNLKDWADLGQLIDEGVEVHFSQESLDLHTRGGRLSADIQAVVAADFIRNLREETRKGMYGRLKQGFYPLRAPLGYLDQGKAKPKVPDPHSAHLIRKAFELYATGRYNLTNLREDLERLGLRNKSGGPVSRNGLSTLLNNPFYVGIMRIERSGETFPGIHEPLVSVALFEQVQAILKGKSNTSVFRHSFLFRRLLTCRHCGHRMVGEIQKGHVYYRCHVRGCPTKGVREDHVEDQIVRAFSAVQLRSEEVEELKQLVTSLRRGWTTDREASVQTHRLRLAQIKDRLDRLTDAYIDRLIERPVFEERRQALLFEQKETEQRLAALSDDTIALPDQIDQILERAKSLYSSYISATPPEKREILKTASSNRRVDGKNVAIELQSPFLEIANREKSTYGDPYRDIPRTFAKSLFALLLSHVKAKTVKNQEG